MCGYLFPTFSKMVWFAPYKQIGIVFTLNNNNDNKKKKLMWHIDIKEKYVN